MKNFLVAVITVVFIFLSMSSGWSAEPKHPWYFPLEIRAGISSTFGEFRGDRLHTGVDLKTNGQNGYKVYAIDDGVIVRLGVRKLGFGKAVYIQHPNGLMTAYCHLDRFEEQALGLETLIQEYRKQRGTKYPGDIYLEKPVKRGQLIGYSGETGSGLPHLHFELRQGGATPIDPFKHGFAYEDKTLPVIESLIIEPLGFQSFLDGEHFAREYRTETLQGKYRITPVPRISGKVRFTAAAYDQIGAENKCNIDQIDLYIAHAGVNKLDLTIDKEKLFSNQFNWITYQTDHRGGLVYEYNLTRLSNPTQYYYRLYTLSPERFPYREVFAKNNGIWDATTAKEGLHTIMVEVRDAGGNVSQAQMQVEVIHAGKMPVLPGTIVNMAEIPTLQGSTNMKVYEFYDFIEVVFQPNTPLANPPTVLISQEGKPAGHPRSQEIVLTPRGLNLFSGTYALTPDKGGILNLKVRATTKTGKPIEEIRQFPVNPIPAASGGTVSYGSKAAMSFPPGALYEDIFANIFPTTAYEETAGLPLMSAVYDFRPAGCPLEKKGNIRMQYPEQVKNPKKLGIFWWDNIKKHWYYMDDQLGPQTRSLTAEIIYPSIYAILQDNVNPVISDFVPVDGSTVPATMKEISAIITDVGKGVDEAAIVMKLDGKTVDGEYDPDRDKYAYPLTKPLKVGTHTLSVQAADKAGNPAKPKTVTFTVN